MNIRRGGSWLSSRWRVLALTLGLAVTTFPATSDAKAAEAVQEPRPSDAPVATGYALKLPSPPPGFELSTSGWVRLVYPTAMKEKAFALAAVAMAEKPALEKALGAPVLEGLEFRLARTPEEMTLLSPKELPPPPYASGVAYPSVHMVAVSLQAPMTFEATDAEETLRHELAHIALDDATLGHPVPRWFNEGLAVFESGEGVWARRNTLWQAVLSGTLIPFDELSSHFPDDHAEVGVAYAESADFVRYLLREPDKARFDSLIARVRAGTPFQRALEDSYGTDVRKLEYQWRKEVAHRYGVVPFILTSGTTLWGLAVVLFAIGYARKRREAKARLAVWAREDAMQDDRARLAQMAASRDLDASDEPMIHGPEIPVVEHGGSWHTLH